MSSKTTQKGMRTVKKKSKVPTSELKPIHPLDAPGMPPVGDYFLRHAMAHGDKDTEITGTGKNQKRSYGRLVEDLVRNTLYPTAKNRQLLEVHVKADRYADMDIVPGALWDPTQKFLGPQRADVMVLSKQLSPRDVRARQPFRHGSGDFLLSHLRELGFDGIEQWYVTNTIKTSHPDDENGWRDAWVRNFSHILQQELRLVRPKYLLCLGAVAVKAVFGKNKTLSKMAGCIEELVIPIHESEDDEPEYHTIKVIACKHPAAVLRSPEFTFEFHNDLLRFKELISGREILDYEDDIDHRVIDNEEDLIALVKEVKACGTGNIIGMDAEWHGQHPQDEGAYIRTIQVSWAHKKAAAIVINNTGGAPGFRRFLRKKTADGRMIKVRNKLTTRNGVKVAVSLLAELMEGNRPCGHFFSADLEWLTPLGLDLRPHFAAPDNFLDCLTKGGLDTALMAHAIEETADFTLTGQTIRYTQAPRYDQELIAWKEQHCRDNGIKSSDLEGYGECPNEVLYPYANYDADVTRRIALSHLKSLQCDNKGNNCLEAFWVSQRAVLAALEINTSGMMLDKDRVDDLTGMYLQAKNELEAKIREWSNWPDLNLNSPFQVRELLFGTKHNGKDLVDGIRPKLSPPDANLIEAVPILTTEKRPRKWSELTAEDIVEQSASTNKTVLAMMYHDADRLLVERDGKKVEMNYREQVEWVRDYRYISQILKSVLRIPLLEEDEVTLKTDEDGHWTYKGGIPGAVCGDGMVRTTIYQTKETGRWSSARPPLQNISKRREPDYKRILGGKYKYPLRSILKARPGYALVEADYIGAELFGMAIMSGDPTMIDHAKRNQLSEHDPDFYDIHSNIAVLAFGYTCPPTKAGLAALGKKHMRIVAKSVIFGIAYGRGAKAIALAAKEEGVDVTQDEAQTIIDTVFTMYDQLIPFFNECRKRAVGQDGWLCGPFGRFRRFYPTDDRKIRGDIERQAQNFPIQGMIADAVSLAIANVYDYREEAYANGETRADLDYNIVLQVHDAIICEVKTEHVPRYIDEVLPACMIDGVAIYPCTLDGVPTGAGPYTLGLDSEVAEHWGVTLDPGESLSLGIDPKYAGWEITNDGYVNLEVFPGKIWSEGSFRPLDG